MQMYYKGTGRKKKEKKKEDNSQLNLLELSKKVTTLPVLLHGLRISIFVTFDVTLITISNDTCIFYPSELLKDDRQGRSRDKFIYKKIENLKLCPLLILNFCLTL